MPVRSSPPKEPLSQLGYAADTVLVKRVILARPGRIDAGLCGR